MKTFWGVILLAVILWIYLPIFQDISFVSSEEQFVKAMLRQYKLVLTTYFKDNCNYPTSEQGLRPLVEHEYAQINMADPWENPYIYINNQSTITIMSFGADGKAGGTGYDADIYEKWDIQPVSKACIDKHGMH